MCVCVIQPLWNGGSGFSLLNYNFVKTCDDAKCRGFPGEVQPERLPAAFLLPSLPLWPKCLKTLNKKGRVCVCVCVCGGRKPKRCKSVQSCLRPVCSVLPCFY